MSKNHTSPAKQTVLKATNSLKGRPYKLGGNGSVLGEDFDCFGMLVEYCKNRYARDILSYEIATKYPVNNYEELYNGSYTAAMEVFKSFVKNCFLKIVPEYIMSGDIILVSADDKECFAIYCSNQVMLVTAPETGCVVVSLDQYKMKDVYRWPQLSQ